MRIMTKGSVASSIKSASFVPMDISGNILWLDGKDPTTVTEVTGVSLWEDKSPSGTDVSQPDPDRQPTYNPATGLISFVTANHYYLYNNSTSLDIQTIFIVASVGNAGSFNPITCNN